jgi:hypothetical protein
MSSSVHEPFPERPALLFDLVFPSRSEHLLLNLGIADAHGLTPMSAGLGTQKNAVPSPCDSSLHASRAYRIPTAAALEAVVMGKPRVKPNYRRRVLRLPDLDHCKTAVLNSLGSPASRRVYEYAIDQFIAWYCSEPRLAFNRIVVVRYRMYLESRHLAANTINQQLAACVAWLTKPPTLAC